MFLVLALILILGCSSTPQQAQPASNPQPEYVLRLCNQSGDPGCLGYATRCKMTWKVDASCQPLAARCSQNWIGEIEQACRIVFGEDLAARQEQVLRKTEDIQTPQPLPAGNLQIKEVVTQQPEKPKVKVTVTEEGSKETTYICNVELPEGCSSPQACGIVNRQVCFPDQ